MVAVHLAHRVGRDHVTVEHRRTTRCCIEVVPELLELLRNLKHLDLVAVLDGKQQVALILMVELVARRSQPLEQRFFEIMRNTEHFASRLHLRPEHGVNIVQLLKAEHRHLDRHIFRLGVQPGAVAHIAQPVSQHDPCCNVYHRHAGDLADIGHRTGGTGIDLNDIDVPIINHILDIYQPDHLERPGQPPSVGNQGSFDLLGKGLRWIDRDRVTRVDARPLDMLHDAGDQVVLPVADRVHLDLLAHHIFVDQNRVLNQV